MLVLVRLVLIGLDELPINPFHRYQWPVEYEGTYRYAREESIYQDSYDRAHEHYRDWHEGVLVLDYGLFIYLLPHLGKHVPQGRSQKAAKYHNSRLLRSVVIKGHQDSQLGSGTSHTCQTRKPSHHESHHKTNNHACRQGKHQVLTTTSLNVKWIVLWTFSRLEHIYIGLRFWVPTSLLLSIYRL